MVITSSENAGRCEALFPLTGYEYIGFSFEFPIWWMVHPTGAEGSNLLFETDQRQEVFVQLTRANFPLERADEATYSFERSGPDPLVDPEEQRISEKIQTIGDKEALVLITADSNLSIKRYFVIHDSMLYMFEIRIPKLRYDDEGTTTLFIQVEGMISSMQFVR